MSISNKVLLPDPLGPTTATIWPGSIRRSTGPSSKSPRNFLTPSSKIAGISCGVVVIACLPCRLRLFFPLQRLFEEAEYLLPAQAGSLPRPCGLPHGLLKGFAEVRENGTKELYTMGTDPYQERSTHRTADSALIQRLLTKVEEMRVASGEKRRQLEAAP